MSLTTAGQALTLQLEVRAERLSPCTIELSLQGGRIRARFHTLDGEASACFSSRVHELEEAMIERGLAVESLEVLQTEPQRSGRPDPRRGSARMKQASMVSRERGGRHAPRGDPTDYLV